MGLRLASQETTRLEVGDDGWIEVVKDISRKQFNSLLAALPEGVSEEEPISVVAASGFTQRLFGIFVTAWSVVDENNNPVPVSEENYENLSRDSALAIDSVIVEYFNSLTPDTQVATKSKDTSK